MKVDNYHYTQVSLVCHAITDSIFSLFLQKLKRREKDGIITLIYYFLIKNHLMLSIVSHSYPDK